LLRKMLDTLDVGRGDLARPRPAPNKEGVGALRHMSKLRGRLAARIVPGQTPSTVAYFRPTFQIVCWSAMLAPVARLHKDPEERSAERPDVCVASETEIPLDLPRDRILASDGHRALPCALKRVAGRTSRPARRTRLSAPMTCPGSVGPASFL